MRFRSLRRLFAPRKPENWDKLTFSQKIAWRCAHPDPDVDYAVYADKFRAKEIVRGRLPFPETIAYHTRVDEIDARALPPTYVMKASHGWKMSLLVENGIVRGTNFGADASGRAADTKYLLDVARSWMASRDERKRRNSERHYRSVKPGILFEAQIEPIDFELKLFLFHGQLRYAQVFYRDFHHGNMRYRHFDGGWRELPADESNASVYATEADAISIPGPTTMKTLAAICGGIDHVRVDLYHACDDFYFSEFTFTHNGTGGPGLIGNFDASLGAFWTR